jgi:hypothetical protein
VNVQLAVDTESRAVVGVEVTNEGSDNNDLSGPMRRQVEGRTGQKVGEHLMDGGYLKLQDVQMAAQDGVTVYVPPKPPRNADSRRAGTSTTRVRPTRPSCRRGGRGWAAGRARRCTSCGPRRWRRPTPT